MEIAIGVIGKTGVTIDGGDSVQTDSAIHHYIMRTVGAGGNQTDACSHKSYEQVTIAR